MTDSKKFTHFLATKGDGRSEIYSFEYSCGPTRTRLTRDEACIVLDAYNACDNDKIGWYYTLIDPEEGVTPDLFGPKVKTR